MKNIEYSNLRTYHTLDDIERRVDKVAFDLDQVYHALNSEVELRQENVAQLSKKIDELKDDLSTEIGIESKLNVIYVDAWVDLNNKIDNLKHQMKVTEVLFIVALFAIIAGVLTIYFA